MHNSRDLLYNIVPIVNNVLCTLKFKKVNRTLSVLNTHTEAQETLEALDMSTILIVVMVS